MLLREELFGGSISIPKVSKTSMRPPSPEPAVGHLWQASPPYAVPTVQQHSALDTFTENWAEHSPSSSK